MNCQDITRILDERDVAALPAAEHAKVEAHIARCKTCSEEWEVHAQIRAQQIPPMPAALVAWHPDCEGEPVTGRVFRRSRMLVIPVLLLAGAVAAMYALDSFQGNNERAFPTEIVDQGAQVPATKAGPAPADVLDVPGRQTAGSAYANSIEPLRNRLLVLPTIYETASQSSIAAADGVYRAMLRFLRAQPNLELVLVTDAELAAAEAAAARLDLSGISEARAIDRRNREIRRQLGSDNTIRVLSRGRADGSAFWTVQILHTRAHGAGAYGTTGPSDDDDFDVIGENLARRNFARMFPDSFAARPIVDIADTTRSDEDRLYAIQSFMMESVLLNRRGGLEDDPLMVPTVDAATDFARLAADANTRRRAWEFIGQLGHPAVVRPMTDALLYDDDAGVREAVAIALSHFKDDANVRAALESTAVADGSLRVRMQARLSLFNDDERFEYVYANLFDTTRTPDERLAPLAVARSTPTRVGTASERPEIPPMLPAALDKIANLVSAVESEEFREVALVELARGGDEAFVDLMRNEPVAAVRSRVIGELRSRDISRGEMTGFFERLLEFETDERALFYINRYLNPEEFGPPRASIPGASTPGVSNSNGSSE